MGGGKKGVEYLFLISFFNLVEEGVVLIFGLIGEFIRRTLRRNLEDIRMVVLGGIGYNDIVLNFLMRMVILRGGKEEGDSGGGNYKILKRREL